MKKSWILFVLAIILIMVYKRSASGYNQPFMPFYSGKQFQSDHLSN